MGKPDQRVLGSSIRTRTTLHLERNLLFGTMMPTEKVGTFMGTGRSTKAQQALYLIRESHLRLTGAMVGDAGGPFPFSPSGRNGPKRWRAGGSKYGTVYVRQTRSHTAGHTAYNPQTNLQEQR